MNWARRLKRVFKVEIEQCVRCDGCLKVIASIEEPELIERILAHRRERGEGRRRWPRSGRERRRRLRCFDSADCDPVFTAPWTIEVFMYPQAGDLVEFACHEGNYGLRGILSARARKSGERRTVDDGT